MKVKIEYLKPVIEEIEVDDKFAELVKVVKEAKVRPGCPWDYDNATCDIVYEELEPQGKGLRQLWEEIYNINDEYEISTIYTEDGIIIDQS